MRRVLLAALVLGISLRAADPVDPLRKLNVAVLDAHGQPVTDLTASDFQILDDGKPQPIVFFRSGGKTGQTTLAAREYSNHASQPRPMIAILFDMLNDRLLGDAAVRTEIVDSLKNMESGENIYLYLLTPKGELFPVHPIPRPDTELQPEAEPWTRQIGPILDQALKPFIGFHQVDELDPKNRYRETVAALSELGGQMNEVTGRKTLVWVTHGFPLIGYSMSVRGRIDVTKQVQDFFGRMALSQILMYPVDQSRRGAGAALDTYSAQTLDEAAELTGGRRLTSDRVGDAITQSLADARANYEVAYAISAARSDKKRHKIKVTATRKDVHIETLQAYYDSQTASAEDLEQSAIGNAIHSPFDATDVGVKASLTPASEALKFTLNIAIDPADLLLAKTGDLHTGSIEVLLAGYDTNGVQQASKPIPFNLKLTEAQLEAAGKGGLTIHQTLTVRDTTMRVRVVVYDARRSATGSVTVPVKP